jgi:hypothetical protein
LRRAVARICPDSITGLTGSARTLLPEDKEASSVSPNDLQIWLNHFEYHAEHPRQLPPGIPDLLTEAERELIASSIATFQLGEQSEGSILVRAARRFADAHRLPSLVRIVELFIREEQRHAALLRDFLADHQIPLKRADWTDRAFRCVRRVAGLELYLHVLISAELIGNVYYRALETVTACQRLKVLCRTLVCDELAHVGFESGLLLALRARRAAPMRTVMRLAHRMFFAATAAVVWSTHAAVLRRGGYRARTFLSACLAQHSFYLDPVDTALAPSSLS